jgi:HK97 family phage major capsid protein
MTVQELQIQADQATREASALYERTRDQSDREGRRPFTSTERQMIQTAIERADGLRRQLSSVSTSTALQAEIERLTGGRVGASGNTLGAQFVNSTAGRWLRESKNRGSRWESPVVEIADPRGFGVFATTITEGGTGGVPPPPQYLPGIVPVPLRIPVVADLLASGPTNSNAIVYLQETSYTVAAAAVAEASAKPEAAIAFAQKTEPVVKLAHWIPVTDELLEDVPAMATYIDARLMRGVEIVEDDQLLNGSGVAPNLLGLLARPGLAPDVARGTDTNADAIAKQMAAIQTTTNLIPTGVIIHPTNWETIALSKNTQGGYYGAGPFQMPTPPTLWGKPAAITPAIPVGTALVVCGTAATVFRRGGINVQASNSHQDYFIKNLTAIRAEERIALAVMVPAAFGKVTGLN